MRFLIDCRNLNFPGCLYAIGRFLARVTGLLDPWPSLTKPSGEMFGIYVESDRKASPHDRGVDAAMIRSLREHSAEGVRLCSFEEWVSDPDAELLPSVVQAEQASPENAPELPLEPAADISLADQLRSYWRNTTRTLATFDLSSLL